MNSRLEVPGSRWSVRDFAAERYPTYDLATLAGLRAGGLPQQVAYLFALRSPEPGSAEADACRRAAPEVLATFRFAEE